VYKHCALGNSANVISAHSSARIAAWRHSIIYASDALITSLSHAFITRHSNMNKKEIANWKTLVYILRRKP